MSKVILFVAIILLTIMGSGFLADHANWPVADPGAPRRAEILFLGNTAKHHDSGKFAPSLAIDLFARSINITYTTDTGDLNPETLSKYDGMIIYANYDSINPSQEKALKDFVEGGKGLVALHSASYCFFNSDWYIQTVGAKFKSHGTGVFKALTVNPNHPVMQGVREFSSWDESYIHEKINPDKIVLQERTNNDGSKEPWTWVRMQGKGRVFYTAGGHNDSTWTKRDFVKMIGNGVLWSIGDRVAAQVAAFRPPVLRYDDTIIVPNYPRPVPYTSLNATPKIAPKYQFALTVEESMKTMQVPVGFEVQLFAAEPDITNPIAMSWDEKGRLWVIESVDYPNTFVETDGAKNDRIKICEDTNGDGKADKFTVFADKLNIPSSLVFADGGVIVSMAPGFLFLKDTNGDDKADVIKMISSGWGKTDTHAGPSNLLYGFDNKIWGVVGYSGYSGPVDGKNNGVTPAQALYRLNTDGTGIEFLAQSTNNTWGLGFTEDNHVFVSTANGNHSDYFSMPARLMQRALPPAVQVAVQTGGRAGQARAGLGVQPLQIIQGHQDMHTLTPNLRQVDVAGGFTAAAGHHFYTARSFPKEYWNRVAFVNEPTGRLIHKSIIKPKGAGFMEEDGWNFLASNDEWVGPVQAEVGPDGAVWVADWYNYIIQHNPTPGPNVSQGKQFARGQGNAYVTPMRDIKYGRIYRIVYKNAKPYTPLRLSKTDVPGLLKALKSDNMFWRMTAQRLLVESRNLAVLPELYKIIGEQKRDAIGLNSPAVHALWTLHGLKVLNGSNAAAINAASRALTNPAAAVRRAAAEVLPQTSASGTAILKAGLLTDKDLNTRMHAFLVLAELPASLEVGKALYTASLSAENSGDEWLSKALLAAAITHRVGFIASTPKEILSSEPAAGETLTLTQRIIKALTNETYMYALQQPNSRLIPLPVDLQGKEITIRASIGPRAAPGAAANQQVIGTPTPLQGFIIGQGGSMNGYGLYIQDGKVSFVVKQDGKTYKATTTDPLPDRFALLAKLAANGEMSIEIDQKLSATAKAPSLFTKPLTGLVRAGLDNPAAVSDKIGTYTGDFAFTGTAQGLSLNLTSKIAVDPMTGMNGHLTNNPAKTVPVQKTSGPLVIDINVVPEAMKFDTKQFSVKAGQKVILNLNNPDSQQHNLIIVSIGSMNKVVAAANAMAADPKGLEKGYVPDMPEVLEAVPLLGPKGSYTLEFTAPTRPGDYPFMCTFPGHWMMMNGIMRVIL